MQPRVILRKVAAAAALLANLRKFARDDFDARAVSVAVALAADQLKREKIIPIAAIIAENRRRAIEVVDHYVHITIVIKITEGRAATDRWFVQRLARRSFSECAVALVAIEQLALITTPIEACALPSSLSAAPDIKPISEKVPAPLF